MTWYFVISSNVWYMTCSSSSLQCFIEAPAGSVSSLAARETQ